MHNDPPYPATNPCKLYLTPTSSALSVCLLACLTTCLSRPLSTCVQCETYSYNLDLTISVQRKGLLHTLVAGSFDGDAVKGEVEFQARQQTWQQVYE